MNRIEKLFSKKKQNILSVYFTAGYPGKDSTVTIIKALANAGVDMIEIGMPFSDPLADGKVIQESSQVALKNGMSLKLLFEQLHDIRNEVEIPLLLMGYLNPVLRYGMEAFLEKTFITGIDGTILPDMPLKEYRLHYKSMYEKFNLCNIFLATPYTSPERLKAYDDTGSGFLYIVSTASTTGTKAATFTENQLFFNNLKKMNLKNPLMIGFGIKDKTSFDEACRFANGAIVGTAFINCLKGEGNIQSKVQTFIENMKA